MKSKKKIIIIVISLILVIAGAVFAYLYFCTDMFKTPEELFYKYAGQVVQTEEKYSYQEMLEELKTAQTKSYTGKTKIGINLQSKGKNYSSMKQQATFNVINGMGLEINSRNNPIEKQASYKIGLNYGGTNITELEVVKDKDTYGVKSEFLDDKYIAVENKNLKSLVKKLGGPTSEIPDQIEFLDMYELLYIPKESQDKIINTYKEIIKENIASDKFQKVENVIQKINNQDLNTTVYTLKMHEKDFYNMMIKIFEVAKEDETLLDLIMEKSKLYLNTNPYMQNYIKSEKINLTKKTLKESLEKIVNDLKDELNYADEKSVAEFVLYVADGKTVRMEYRLEDEIQAAIDFYTADEKEHVVIYAQNNNYSKYSMKKNNKSKSSDLEKIMEIEYKTIEEGEVTKKEGTIIIYEDEENIAKIYLEEETKGKTGYGKNECKIKINIDVEEISIGLTIDSEINYTEDVQIKGLDNKNSKILNSMSKEEIEKLFNNIGKNFEKRLQNKMQDMGLVGSSKIKTPSLLNK